MSYIMKFQFWKNLTSFFYFFEIFLMIPNDKYTWEGQKFILCFITCSLHKKSTIKLKLFDVAISVNFWCHNPSLIESPSVYCRTGYLCRLGFSYYFAVLCSISLCCFHTTLPFFPFLYFTVFILLFGTLRFSYPPIFPCLQKWTIMTKIFFQIITRSILFLENWKLNSKFALNHP